MNICAGICCYSGIFLRYLKSVLTSAKIIRTKHLEAGIPTFTRIAGCVETFAISNACSLRSCSGSTQPEITIKLGLHACIGFISCLIRNTCTLHRHVERTIAAVELYFVITCTSFAQGVYKPCKLLDLPAFQYMHHTLGQMLFPIVS